ncbi:ArsR/SmtB family transcription factor [Brevibacillus migulae]|uniref:ArsR/SmtB family transcription factor n=1 Tax=Brevibacillus migulae TaxID=1644114 RepID=UPI00106E5E17|nr:winged helix-turn-helix domain-containing protein [Brevibacillus migulae]
MSTYPNFAYIAGLIGDPTRAAILNSLLDGRALPASELAYMARVSPQTASAHLAKLVEGGLLGVETQGRHRYYRLASAQVAHVLEMLSTMSPPVQVRSLRQSDQLKEVRHARTCYDHLAGQLGVEVTKRLLERNILKEADGEYQVTAEGEAWFQRFGIDVEAARQKRRALARPCLDWSERRYHLAGTLGTVFTKRLFELDLITRASATRAVHVTEKGKEAFREYLGIEL